MKYQVDSKHLIETNPEDYGLRTKDTIALDDPNHIVIIKVRKSRVIMKDGTNILGKTELIQKSGFNGRISFATNATVCSKTKKFLKEKGINILKLEVS